MATKTLTIMNDVYKLLIDNKIEGESFSEELRRILSNKKKKKLDDFFGILSKETGKSLMSDLNKIRTKQMKMTKKRI